MHTYSGRYVLGPCGHLTLYVLYIILELMSLALFSASHTSLYSAGYLHVTEEGFAVASCFLASSGTTYVIPFLRR